MPIFSQGATKNKLLILYAMQAMQCDASINHIYQIFFDLDLIPCFDFTVAISDLEEDGAVAAVPRPFGQSYRVTDEGRQLLTLFGESLPASNRAAIRQHVEAHRETVQRETQILSTQQALPDGGFELTLSATEGLQTLFSMTIPAPTAGIARLMRKNWSAFSYEIYESVWRFLGKEDAEESDL
jgi:hypothetical protein